MGGSKRIAVAVVLALVVVAATLGSLPVVASAATPGAEQATLVKVAAATPATVPQVPFIEGVIPEGLSVLVNWNPDPASNEVSKYTLVATVASGFAGTVSKACKAPPAASAPGTDSSALVPALCAGIPYAISMSATNGNGTSATSPKSNPVVPLVAQKPSAPLITSVLPRGGGLVVNWSAPSLTGGDPLSGYSLTATAGGKKITATAKSTATQLTLTKLTNGTTYKITLVATTKAGSSSPGTGSGIPSATAKPQAPQSLQVIPNGHGALVATWSAPSDPGADAVAHYTVTTQPETETDGVWSATGAKITEVVFATVTTDTITGLSSTGFYAVSVVATSAAGSGPATSTTNPVSPTVQLASSTIVLTQATMNALASDDSSGALTWPSPAPPQVASLVSGDVLVGPISTAAPEGLLATITGITDSSGTYVVTTTAASLADAFSNLSFGYSGNPLAQPGSKFQASAAGVRTSPRTSDASLTLSHDFKILGSGVISGDVNLKTNVSLSAEVNGILHPSVSLTSSATAAVVANLDASIAGEHSFTLGEIDFGAIPIQAGLVPLWLFPKILVVLTLNGEIKVGVEASMTVGAGLAWSSQNPNKLITKSLTTGPHMDGSSPLPGVSDGATAAVGLQIQPQIDIDDGAGPNFDVDADLTATVNLLGSPYFKLTPSITLRAGLDFEILDGKVHGSLEVRLGTFNFASFEIKSAPNASLAISPADPTVTPGTPTTFSATRSSGVAHPVTWSLLGATTGDKITTGGVLTTDNPTGRALIVVARDSTGATGNTTVTIGAPFDPVGDLSASQGLNSLAGSVSWVPPASSGGSLMAYYAVFVSDGMAVQTTTGTSVSLSNLSPSSTYTITVYPVNKQGVTGPPATTTLQVAPLCTDTFTGTTSPDWNTASNWSGGYVPGPSDWVCDDGNSITLPSGTTNIEGFQQSGTLTASPGANLSVADTYTDWGTITGGGSLTIPVGTTADLGNDATITGGSHLVNDGSMTLSDDDLYVESKSTFKNVGTLDLTSGTTVDLQDSSSLENAGALLMSDSTEIVGTGTLTNDAGATITYNGSSKSASAQIQATFDDSGTVDVGEGVLTIDRISLKGSPAIAGPGSVSFDAVVLPTVLTLTRDPQLEFTGTTTISSTSSLVGTTHVSLTGTITGGGSLTIPVGTRADLGNDATITGGSHLVNDGSMTLSDDDLYVESKSTFKNVGTLDLTSGTTVDLQDSSSLENAGALLMADSTEIVGTGTLTNDAGATITYNGSSKSASAQIQATFDDSGTVEVGEGVLTIDRISLKGSPAIAGPGSVSFDAVVLPTVLTLTRDPQLEFTGTTTISSTSSLVGTTHVSLTGTITGGGSLTIPVGTTADLGNDATITGGSHLVNDGSMTLSDDDLYVESKSTFKNVGTLDLTSGTTVDLQDSSSLENAGALSMADSTEIVGTGTLTNDAGATITYNGSSKSASAQIQATFDDSGMVEVGEGMLAVPTYGPTSASTFEVGANTSPGRLSVSGKATLKGNLTVATRSGYLPAIGTKVTVLTAGSRTGTFSTLTGTQLAGEHWAVSYTATSVVLTVARG